MRININDNCIIMKDYLHADHCSGDNKFFIAYDYDKAYAYDFY